MANLSKTTKDHEEIQRWAEERGGKPSHVKSTSSEEEVGILRIDFPGFSGEGSLEEISWDDFFEKFDARNLALVYQEETADGERSNFNKLVSGDSVETDEESEPKSAARKAAKRKASAKSTGRTSTGKKTVPTKAPAKAVKKTGTVPAKKTSSKMPARKTAPVKKGAAVKKSAPAKKMPAKKIPAKKVAVKKTAGKKAATKKRR